MRDQPPPALSIKGLRKVLAQTCFQCEAYCPTDALFVAPLTTPVAADTTFRDATHLRSSGLLGGYRRELGWGGGRKLGARTAVGPEYPD